MDTGDLFAALRSIRWEYDVQDWTGRISWVDWLDNYGRNGWELVGWSEFVDKDTLRARRVCTFKRVTGCLREGVTP